MQITINKMILAAAVFLAASFAFTGCSRLQPNSLPVVKLSIWWSDEKDRDLLEQTIDSFQKRYADEAVFEITISRENVSTSKETVLTNPQSAADIYMFADDQFEALRQAGALLEITENTEQIIIDNGGPNNGACRAAMYDNKLYAYPLTAGNGYFLYYNSAYFTSEDVTSLDRILDISAQNGKKTAIDYSSGWYIYSFFKGSGLEIGLSRDGRSNYCNWNATDTPYKGIDVANAMLAVAAHDGFINCDDQGFLEGIENGNIIAGINGAWNSESIKEM